VEEVEDVLALVEQVVGMAADVEGKHMMTGKCDGYRTFNVMNFNLQQKAPKLSTRRCPEQDLWGG